MSNMQDLPAAITGLAITDLLGPAPVPAVHQASAAAPATPHLNSLLAAEPDLVDRIFAYLLDVVPGLASSAEQLAEAQAAVREEFGGESTYVARRSPTKRQRLAGEILANFNGRNATEVARRLGVSRATVYRVIKQPGVSK